MPAWARDYFEIGYAQRWGLPSLTDDVRRQVSGLCGLLPLDAGSLVIDIACGHGRHAIAFAERGHSVVGVDFAAALLTRARELGSALGSRVGWIRGDMRRLPLRSGLADSAIVTDSLGFFETDEENDAVLREAARVLKPGGGLALKVVNGAPILDNFRDVDREERDGVVVSTSRTLVQTPPSMIERVRVSGCRGCGEYVRHQRLYRVDDLRDALNRLGLSTVSVFSTADGAPFDPVRSSTMWIIAHLGEHST